MRSILFIPLLALACASPSNASDPAPAPAAAAPAVAAPALEAPAVEAPAVEAPAVEAPWAAWSEVPVRDVLARELECKTPGVRLHLYPEGRADAQPLTPGAGSAEVNWKRDGDDIVVMVPSMATGEPLRLTVQRGWRSGLAFWMAGPDTPVRCRVDLEPFAAPAPQWIELRDGGAGAHEVARVAVAARAAVGAPDPEALWVAPGPAEPASGLVIRYRGDADRASAEQIAAAVFGVVEAAPGASAPITLVVGP